MIIKTETVAEEEKPDVSQEESMQVDPADDLLAIPGPSGLCKNSPHTELDIKEEDDSVDTVVSSPPKSVNFVQLVYSEDNSGTDITVILQASTSTPEYEEVTISDDDEAPPEEAGADWTPDSQSPKRRPRKSFPRKISDTKKPASAGLEHVIEQTGTVSILHGHLHRKAVRPQFITGGSPAVQSCKVLNVPPMSPAPGFNLCYAHEELLPPGGCHGTIELNPLASCSIRSVDQSDSAYTFKEDSFLQEMRLNPQCITRFATLALMTEALVMTSSPTVLNSDNCELLYFKENSRLLRAFGVGACHRSELRKLIFSHCTLADNRAEVRTSSTFSYLLKWIYCYNDTISEQDLEQIVIAEEGLIKLMSKNKGTGKKASTFPKVARLRVIVQHFLEMLHRCVPNSRMPNNADIWQLEGMEYAGFLGVKTVHTCQLPKLLVRHTILGKKKGWCDPGYLTSLKKNLALDLEPELLNHDHGVRHIFYYRVRCPSNMTAEEAFVLDNQVNGVEMEISKYAFGTVIHK